MVDRSGVTFLWEGLDRNGGRTRGEIVARSEITARAELRRQGIRVVRIRKKPKTWFRSSNKISTKEIAVFSRQLATMLAAGVPLVQAFDIVGSSHDNPAMQALLLEIRSDVAAGSPLADALAKHPVQFDELFCNLVRAGEQAGVLETLLRKIADYKEKSESLKGKIRKALTYPTAIVAVAVIVTAILLIFVVPTFEELFKSFGADLPVFTRWVIRLSHGVQDWWFVIMGGLGLAGFGFAKLRQRSPTFRYWVDRWLLALPVIGLILHKSAVARFARTLATMSAAGVPLVEAMQSVAGATGNSLYATAVLQMRDEVATGQQLQAAMRQVELFPSMVVQMVAIGEESGVLDTMLGKVADFYEEEVDNAVDSLSSLLEPMIMVVLGVLVGGLVVAMYLPIFRLGSVI
ncbi:MAG TPA: type II secretion system F family protein [Methylococcus sp.]|nr:type II secretion system F family protein [Methylococcus sp.]